MIERVKALVLEIAGWYGPGGPLDVAIPGKLWLRTILFIGCMIYATLHKDWPPASDGDI
jgi:hypothetical protein